MNYEIEFLPVGNGEKSGDAILIRYGEESKYTIIVIDGGTKESGKELVDHIREYYHTEYVDYIVNTHPDQDHASGLSVVMEELEVGELWIHQPWEHTSKIIDYFKDQRMTELSLAERLKEKFPASYNLEKIAIEKNIPIYEPYQGSRIGEFTILSPSEEWYLHELIPKFNKTPQEKNLFENNILSSISDGIRNLIEESLDIETLGEDGETSSDNESSVIMHAEFDSKGILFTGDAGIKALNKAYDYFPALSSNLKFIQIPHHGSKRNVSPSILNSILGEKGQDTNKKAFVSASKEAKKHPRQVVINAFIRRGCQVISTEGSVKRHKHNMANREGWIAATPLEFKNEFEDNN